MHPYHALREMLRQLDPGATIVIDGGELSHWAMMSLPEAWPRRTMGCGYLGFLGMTPGLAIGAQVAEPDRRVVLIIGDGGAGFHPQEFDTMVRHGLPIVVVVVNNECWGMSLHGQQILYGHEAGIVSVLADTEYEKVAAGFGAAGFRVDRLEDVGPVIRAALEHGGPACVNLAVSGDVVHPITEAMLGMVGAGGTVIPYYDNVPAASPAGAPRQAAT
jgi:acetolactate synthase-1/2/3 large subunit